MLLQVTGLTEYVPIYGAIEILFYYRMGVLSPLCLLLCAKHNTAGFSHVFVICQSAADPCLLIS